MVRRHPIRHHGAITLPYGSILVTLPMIRRRERIYIQRNNRRVYVRVRVAYLSVLVTLTIMLVLEAASIGR
jgi:hypothetical protein